MPRKTRGKTTAKTNYLAREQRREPMPAEEKLWQALRDRRLAGLKFRRQHPFGPYILDYFCVEQQIEIEIDGGIHTEPDQVVRDIQRTEFLNHQGVRIMRFDNAEIENHLNQVLKQIQASCSPSPDVPSSGEGVRG